jgi:pimeloyl-ACP methyl ester carboxylesterase
MNTIIALILVITVLLLTGVAIECLAERRDRRRFPHPGRMVLVGDRKLHLVLTGTRQPGEPLVLLETGMGSWSFHWRLVQSEIAQFTRVCSYDRFGLGWSDPGESPRHAERIATELHQALQAAGEHGSYLLVGHSLGGIFVRQFARLYPDEVWGMVLVDSAHEDQLERMPWAREEAKNIKAFFTLLAMLHRVGILRLFGNSLLASFPSVSTAEEKRAFLSVLLASCYFQTTRDESLSLLDPLKKADRLSSLDGKSLAVIQAGGRPDPLPRGYTEERWQEQRRAWDSIQQDLLKLSTNSRLEIAENSIHTVQVEQPDIVIEAIKQILGR